MTAPPLAPTGAPATPAAPQLEESRRPDRAWILLLAVGAIATVAGAALLVTALRGPALVTPRFAGGEVVATEWGNAEAWGQPGSWVLDYQDGTTMSITVPWSGGPVTEARLGVSPVDLATITDTEVVGDELVATISFDGCDYFHERELQVFPAMTVITADGGTTQVTFDRPLFVRSPMLWQCPDRNIDRNARNRSDL